jgi:hypothetical protein
MTAGTARLEKAKLQYSCVGDQVVGLSSTMKET